MAVFWARERIHNAGEDIAFDVANTARHSLKAQSNPESALNQSTHLRGKDVIV